VLRYLEHNVASRARRTPLARSPLSPPPPLARILRAAHHARRALRLIAWTSLAYADQRQWRKRNRITHLFPLACARCVRVARRTRKLRCTSARINADSATSRGRSAHMRIALDKTYFCAVAFVDVNNVFKCGRGERFQRFAFCVWVRSSLLGKISGANNGRRRRMFLAYLLLPDILRSSSCALFLRYRSCTLARHLSCLAHTRHQRILPFSCASSHRLLISARFLRTRALCSAARHRFPPRHIITSHHRFSRSRMRTLFISRGASSITIINTIARAFRRTRRFLNVLMNAVRVLYIGYARTLATPLLALDNHDARFTLFVKQRKCARVALHTRSYQIMGVVTGHRRTSDASAAKMNARRALLFIFARVTFRHLGAPLEQFYSFA